MNVVRMMAVTCCLLICPVPQGLGAPQPVEGLVNLRFQLDVRVFAAMAALRASGFDPESGAAVSNSVGKRIQERLAGVSPELRERLQKFSSAVDRESDPVQRQSKYVSYALLLNGPPAFTLSYKPGQIPAGIRAMQGFESLVAELWVAADLGGLWDEVRPLYLLEVENYRPLIREMIVETLRYLKTEPRVSLDRQVTFIPDLLNAPGVVNARNIGSNYVVAVGPAKAGERPIRSVRHEYLHFLFDPFLQKYEGSLPEAEPFLKRVNEQPAAQERYRRDFFLMVTESLLQMVELRLDKIPEERRTAAMFAAYDRGLILAPYFEESLSGFEHTVESMPEAFQALIEGIRWDAESKRGESMRQLRAGLETRPARTETATQDQTRGLLDEANRHLTAREFGRAREILEQVLRQDPENSSALFGMGQVVAQEQEFEPALELFERAAAHSREETWIAAWSYVRRGNIYRFLEKPDQARAEWERALQLQGDLRGAADAARKSLSEVTP